MDPKKNPYAVLLAKLSGIHAPPKALQAAQQYSKEAYESVIEPEIGRRWESGIKDGRIAANAKQTANFRSGVTRELFLALPEAERKRLAEKAKDDAAANKKAYEDALKAPPSKAPADRQKYVSSTCLISIC